MADKTMKSIQVAPITNGFLLVTQEHASVPNVQPKVEQNYFATAKEACDAAERFLDPSNITLLPGGPKRIS